MSNVVPLRPANDDAGEWASGDAVCIGCKHKWVQVAQVGQRWLQCPACSGNKGIFQNPFGAGEGDSVYLCSYCGGEALTAYYHESRLYFRCIIANELSKRTGQNPRVNIAHSRPSASSGCNGETQSAAFGTGLRAETDQAPS